MQANKSNVLGRVGVGGVIVRLEVAQRHVTQRDISSTGHEEPSALLISTSVELPLLEQIVVHVSNSYRAGPYGT